jgi:hypothetical protein
LCISEKNEKVVGCNFVRSGTNGAFRKVLGSVEGADLYFINFGIVEAPIVPGAGRTGILCAGGAGRGRGRLLR